jgi:hypothetical protein
MPHKDPAVRKAFNRIWYEKNKVRILARMKERKDEINVVKRARYQTNKVVILAKMRAYQEKNKNRVAAWQKKGSAKYRIKMRDAILQAYGNKCQCCGETEKDFLTLDHVGGWGARHRREEGWKARGHSLYKRIIEADFPKDKFRLLCMNCNFAIRLGGTCPHESERLQARMYEENFECAREAAG